MQNFVCKLKPGDIIVAGTDGLFDNVFSHRTTKLVWDAKKHGALPGVAAQQLATFASARSMDPVYLSPFAKAAAQAGFFYRGGKVDDITVVVSYVTAAKSSGADAAGGDAKGSTPLEVRSESGDSSGSTGGSNMSGATTEKANISATPEQSPPKIPVPEPKTSPTETPKESVAGLSAASPQGEGLASESAAVSGVDPGVSGGSGAGDAGGAPGSRAARTSAVNGGAAAPAETLANSIYKVSQTRQVQSKL